MAFCAQCGHKLKEGSRFCPACGAPVAARRAAAGEEAVRVPASDATTVLGGAAPAAAAPSAGAAEPETTLLSARRAGGVGTAPQVDAVAPGADGTAPRHFGPEPDAEAAGAPLPTFLEPEPARVAPEAETLVSEPVSDSANPVPTFLEPEPSRVAVNGEAPVAGSSSESDWQPGAAASESVRVPSAAVGSASEPEAVVAPEPVRLGDTAARVDPVPQAEPAWQPAAEASQAEGDMAPAVHAEDSFASAAPASPVSSASQATSAPQPEPDWQPPVPPTSGTSSAGAPPTPPVQPTSHASRSPLSRGWEDWKASTCKFSVVAKLALFQLVPFLGSMVASGYAYTWGKECALGRETSMSSKLIRPGVLDNGLYGYCSQLIVTVLAMICLFVATGLLGAIRLGALAILLWIAALVVVGPLSTLFAMRGALCGRIRSGLNVSHVWTMFTTKGKASQLLAAFWAPGVVTALVTCLLYLVFSAVLGVVFYTAALSAFSSLGYYGGSGIMSSLGGAGFGSLLLLAALLFCLFFVSTSAKLVTARALGYWLRDFDPASWSEYQENSGRYANEAL